MSDLSQNPRIRIASVSYLNARPLIHGLENEPTVALSLDVPSRLLDSLRAGWSDVALLPVIDYARLDGLTILPAGGIGSDGPTLTVRIFSRVPIERITSLACDPDSHTSVGLARIILAKRFGVTPEFCELSRITSDDLRQARLLIGDKVVCEAPLDGFDHQFDLGQEWKAMTGLPFVFAVWMARDGVDHARAMEILTRAKQAGVRDIERIVQQYAVPRGWPVDLARDYLTKHIQYDIGSREVEAAQLFLQSAADHRIIPPVAPLSISAVR